MRILAHVLKVFCKVKNLSHVFMCEALKKNVEKLCVIQILFQFFIFVENICQKLESFENVKHSYRLFKKITELRNMNLLNCIKCKPKEALNAFEFHLETKPNQMIHIFPKKNCNLS